MFTPRNAIILLNAECQTTEGISVKLFENEKEWKLWTVSILSIILAAVFLLLFCSCDFGTLWKAAVVIGTVGFLLSGVITTAELIHRYRYKFLNNQSGWILLESLIGTTIIAVGITAIMASYVQTTKSASFSDNATQATYLAQQKLENLKKTYDGSATKPVLPATATSGIFTVSYTEETTTEAAAPIAGLKVVPVTVTVAWTDSSSSAQNSVNVTAYYFYY